VLITHNRMLEAQISQKASFSSMPPDRIPSQPKPNHNEQCNAMILRGGKQLERPKEIANDESLHDKNEHVQNLKEEMSSPSKEVIDDVVHKLDVVPKDPKIISLKPYTPPLPFHQRMAKAKLDMQFGKCLEFLKKLYINMLFTEALTQMPSYAKIFKEILSNKIKFEEYETIALTEECSAAIQNKLSVS